MAMTLSIPSNLTNFGPGLRISLYGSTTNVVNIFGSTLYAQEED